MRLRAAMWFMIYQGMVGRFRDGVHCRLNALLLSPPGAGCGDGWCAIREAVACLLCARILGAVIMLPYRLETAGIRLRAIVASARPGTHRKDQGEQRLFYGKPDGEKLVAHGRLN